MNIEKTINNYKDYYTGNGTFSEALNSIKNDKFEGSFEYFNTNIGIYIRNEIALSIDNDCTILSPVGVHEETLKAIALSLKDLEENSRKIESIACNNMHYCVDKKINIEDLLLASDIPEFTKFKINLNSFLNNAKRILTGGYITQKEINEMMVGSLIQIAINNRIKIEIYNSKIYYENLEKSPENKDIIAEISNSLGKLFSSFNNIVNHSKNTFKAREGLRDILK